MNLNDLKNIGEAELTDLKNKQEIATKESARLHAQNERASKLYAIAYQCLKRGVWVGDEVQITGKAGGKQDPTGQLAGFEYADAPYACPLVYLRKKDGKLSEVATRLYSYNTMSKIETPTPTS